MASKKDAIRYSGLDLLRTVAIVAVMLFHGLKYGAPAGDLFVFGCKGVNLFICLMKVYC
ncbi:hypothetical protein [Pseudoalteromonas sp. MSK9-3]|uniref:hypothetical protein n=1 Tax=Pseudoalteromonas sp. MSK9-3 TaxID=1897633 RepID=UPI0015FEDF26|nr:hypothetical protein [Pseudoalteromonas sp. MSK9-3]